MLSLGKLAATVPAMRRALDLVFFALLSLGASGCPTDPPAADWAPAFEPGEQWLLSVWGPAPDDLYTVGGQARPSRGVIFHRDAAGWSEVDTGLGEVPLLNWVYGFGPDDLFVVGERGAILHYDGSAWTAQESGTMESLWGVWGAAPDDVYAVGGIPFAGGVPTVLHYDGSAWSTVELPELERANVFAFFKVWGSGPSDVYVVGQRGVVMHYDGSAWTEMGIGATQDLISVWGTGPDRVAIVGGRGNGYVHRFDGTSWEQVQPFAMPGLNGVWLQGDVIHAVGEQGTIARFDFDTLELLEDDVQDTFLAFHAIFGDGARLTTVGGNFSMPMGPYQGLAYARDLTPAD